MSGRSKIAVSVRLDPEIKSEADRRAAEERRTFTGYLEWLIAKDAEANPRPRGRKDKAAG